MEKITDFGDDIFAGEPIEHLVKILQNASPQAIRNTLEVVLNEYAILNLAVENQSYDIDHIKAQYKDHIQAEKQDLIIRLMSDILSQE